MLTLQHVPRHLQCTRFRTTQVPPIHCCERRLPLPAPSYLSTHRRHYTRNLRIKPPEMHYHFIHITAFQSCSHSIRYGLSSTSICTVLACLRYKLSFSNSSSPPFTFHPEYAKSSIGFIFEAHNTSFSLPPARITGASSVCFLSFFPCSVPSSALARLAITLYASSENNLFRAARF